jgi:hypothetical protein
VGRLPTGFRRDGAGGYTSRMDRVRFGRALGFGARQAMKTLVTAVDAATAENPTAKPRAGAGSAPAGAASRSSAESAHFPPGGETPVRRAAQSAAKTVEQAREVKQGLGRGGRQLGEAVWSPFVRLSGVLWLEVSGVFFGIFALMALGYTWKLRGAWRMGAASHRNLIGALVMFALFGYFCVSNFVRARRRERGDEADSSKAH